MKNIHTFVAKKYVAVVSIIIFVVFCFAVILGCFKKTELVIGEAYSNIVVIDAGHGGLDVK